MSDALKACPFCGGKAELQSSYYPPGHSPQFWALVSCSLCDAAGHEFTEADGKDYEGLARGAWDRRPEPQEADTPELVALRIAMVAIHDQIKHGAIGLSKTGEVMRAELQRLGLRVVKVPCP